MIEAFLVFVGVPAVMLALATFTFVLVREAVALGLEERRARALAWAPRARVVAPVVDIASRRRAGSVPSSYSDRGRRAA
jgi:hypothetical protein